MNFHHHNKNIYSKIQIPNYLLSIRDLSFINQPKTRRPDDTTVPDMIPFSSDGAFDGRCRSRLGSCDLLLVSSRPVGFHFSILILHLLNSKLHNATTLHNSIKSPRFDFSICSDIVLLYNKLDGSKANKVIMLSLSSLSQMPTEVIYI